MSTITIPITIDQTVITITLGYGVTLGETSTTAHRGDRGKTAYDHSQLTTGNPHSVTAEDVGLGDVDNTSDTDKPVSTDQQTALDLKSNKAITFNPQVDDYAIVAGDADKHILMQKATATNLTINDVFTSDQSCTGEQNGDGQVTFVAGSGVTLEIAESLTKSRVKYSTFLIYRTSTTGHYRITGDLE